MLVPDTVLGMIMLAPDFFFVITTFVIVTVVLLIASLLGMARLFAICYHGYPWDRKRVAYKCLATAVIMALALCALVFWVRGAVFVPSGFEILYILGVGALCFPIGAFFQRVIPKRRFEDVLSANVRQ